MRAASFAAHMRHAVVAELEVGTALRTGGYFHADFAIDSIDIYFGTECGFDHADVFFAEDKVAFAGKAFVGFNTDMHVQVALRAIRDGFAVFAQTDGGAIVDTGWHFQLDILGAALGAFAVADGADFFGHLAGTVAGRADTCLLDVAKDGACSSDHLAASLAGIAGFEFIARLGRGAFAVAAGVFEVEFEVDIGTEYRFFEGYFYAGFDVVAARLALPSALLASAEKAAEYIAQAKVAEIEVHILALPESAETFERVAGCAADTGVAELVVALALARVFQDFVGFVQFFELLFVTALFVGVQFYCLPAESLLYLVGAGTFAHAKYIVIIPFRRRHNCCYFSTKASRVLT